MTTLKMNARNMEKIKGGEQSFSPHYSLPKGYSDIMG